MMREGLTYKNIYSTQPGGSREIIVMNNDGEEFFYSFNPRYEGFSGAKKAYSNKPSYPFTYWRDVTEADIKDRKVICLNFIKCGKTQCPHSKPHIETRDCKTMCPLKENSNCNILSLVKWYEGVK